MVIYYRDKTSEIICDSKIQSFRFIASYSGVVLSKDKGMEAINMLFLLDHVSSKNDMQLVILQTLWSPRCVGGKCKNPKPKETTESSTFGVGLWLMKTMQQYQWHPRNTLVKAIFNVCSKQLRNSSHISTHSWEYLSFEPWHYDVLLLTVAHWSTCCGRFRHSPMPTQGMAWWLSRKIQRLRKARVKPCKTISFQPSNRRRDWLWQRIGLPVCI